MLQVDVVQLTHAVLDPIIVPQNVFWLSLFCCCNSAKLAVGTFRRIMAASVLQSMFYVLWPFAATRAFRVDSQVDVIGVSLEERGLTSS